MRTDSILAAVALWLGCNAAMAQQLPMPRDAMHLGAASCASSLCHGSVQPFEGSPIARNEFIIWQSDRYRNMHAKAWDKLRTDEAAAIADRLGLGPATEARECLVCHADDAPVELRGERFQLSDGVTCESCHGAAGRYINAHTEPGRRSGELIEIGLYPTWDAEARSRLCLSCHLGGEGRFINHRILGAGHPRLTFELDTFTFLQPHHVVDEDYTARKGRVDFVRDWAIGQGLAAIYQLDWLMDRDRGWRGIFIEPALLDCHSCHRRLDEDGWKARKSTGLGPGEMRLNDANLTILHLVAIAVDPRVAARLRDGTRALHQATTISVEETLAAAGRLRSEVGAAVGLMRDHRFTNGDLQGILSELERLSGAGEFRDYIAAEQAAMATVNLVLAFERAGEIEKDTFDADLDRLFQVVADPYAYSDRDFGAVIRSLASGVRAASG